MRFSRARWFTILRWGFILIVTAMAITTDSQVMRLALVGSGAYVLGMFMEDLMFTGPYESMLARQRDLLGLAVTELKNANSTNDLLLTGMKALREGRLVDGDAGPV